MRPGLLVRWLLDPRSLKSDTLMPQLPLSRAEAEEIAAFVAQEPLTAPVVATVPVRLPVLERPVSYDEVSKRVFRKICWHCHSQPDLARGDGGPGMTGGFGFIGRELDLSTYESIAGGYLDGKGEVASSFRPLGTGTTRAPALVAVMLARQQEEAGRPSSLRGMPLGLPAMTSKEIQLVESWVAQGRPE